MNTICNNPHHFFSSQSRLRIFQYVTFTVLLLLGGLASAPPANGQGSREANDQWYRDAYRKLFFDYHTYQAARDVARDFDAVQWATQLEESHVQAVSIHALCYRGWRYYRKGVHGYIHPKLPEGLDLIEAQINACREKNIRVIAYFNVCGGEPIRRDHPEWLITGEDGTRASKVSLFSPYFNEMLLPILEEFTTNYDVDGLFFDFLYASDPDDVHAKNKFVAATGQAYPKSDADPVWSDYIAWLLEEGKLLRQKAFDAVHRGNPRTLTSINWSYTYRQPEIPPADVGFLSLDVLPQDQVFEASFIAKNWATLDKPYDIMNSAFLAWWGDWGVKPAETMMQECAAAMANGGRTWIGYQIRPEFYVQPALMNEYRKTFEFVKEREELCKEAKIVPYIALLNSSAGHFTHGPHVFIPDQSLRGAYKMLLESQQQFNILDEVTLLNRISEYKVIILPDQRRISDALAEALRTFTRNGGVVIGTVLTATQNEDYASTGAFQLSDLFGVRLEGPYERNHSYMVLKRERLKKDVLDLPQQAYGSCALVKPTTAQAVAELWEPLLMEDGRYIHSSSPAGTYTGSPAITINDFGKGNAVYFANDIFYAYAVRSQWNLKNILINVLEMTVSEVLLEVEAPASIEVVLAQKNGQQQVHLVNHYREKTLQGANSIAEHIPPVHGIGVKLKTMNRPRSVTVMPDNTALTFEYERGYLSFTVPKVHIYNIVVVD